MPEHRGHETLVQPEGSRVPGQNGRRESERYNHKKPLLFVGRVLGKGTVLQGKGLDGGGQTEGTGNSKIVD